MDFYTLALGTITIWIILTLIDRWVRRRVQKKPDGHLAKFCDKFFHTEEENTPTTEQWVTSGKAYMFAFEGIVSGISAFHLAGYRTDKFFHALLHSLAGEGETVEGVSEAQVQLWRAATILTDTDFNLPIPIQELAKRAEACPAELAAYKAAAKKCYESLMVWNTFGEGELEALQAARRDLVNAITYTYLPKVENITAEQATTSR